MSHFLPEPKIPRLIPVSQVARLCSATPQVIYRLATQGKMPGPFHVGSVIRWDRDAIQSWISRGCPETLERGQP